jgi:heat shock protein HslJ
LTVGLVVVVAVSAAAALGGCSDDGATGSTTSVPSGGLQGTVWGLATVRGPSGISFSSARAVSGDTTCNIFNGSYTAAGGSLQLQLGPMTQRACVDPASATQERNVLAALDATSRYEVSGDVLTLLNGSRQTQATYRRVSSDLAGTTWTLRGLNTGNAVVTSAAVEAYTVAFARDRTLTAKGACGTVTGRYSSDGRSFSFTDGTTDVAGCAQADAQLAQQVLHALTASVTTEHAPGSATFRSADGATQLVLDST